MIMPKKHPFVHSVQVRLAQLLIEVSRVDLNMIKKLEYSGTALWVRTHNSFFRSFNNGGIACFAGFSRGFLPEGKGAFRIVTASVEYTFSFSPLGSDFPFFAKRTWEPKILFF